ncbi:MAG TPA: amylo-alpha-1,6-glucosidase, partial [Polyangiaceae bacterium]|nr:amylo-alpha-1,6-glucosidase [Polyangiaceae bacterium]
VRENNLLLAVDLTNADIYGDGHLLVPHGSLHILRSKFLWQGALYEHVQIANYSAVSVEVNLALQFAADFVDVFEVRGTGRERRGTRHEAEFGESGAVLRYAGLDGEQRVMRIEFAPQPTRVSADRATFQLRLEAKQTKDLYAVAACETRRCPPRVRSAFEHAYTEACADLREHERSDCSLHTSNEQFNELWNRSISDLRMMITRTPHGQYPYAGVPWFSTPFGRDAIITALEALWINPDLARGVLNFLAANQAEESDAEADAEPGKIVHEIRFGEMAALKEIPFGSYYGSVDSTPLFVMLAASYYEATGDLSTVRTLWPNIERALAWMDRYGDLDRDGFVEYGRRSHDGLVQQGWKDSNDSVFHADGTLAEGPIALCEVQGYVYAARLGAARLAKTLGHDDRARELTLAAETLRERFDAAFWCEDLGTYALALDGRKRPCRVRSSNTGQCLFTGIALPSRAASLADQLLSPAMFSGWGIRTLASDERRYNPMSYHNGSVWPHDNALIADGLARYGFKEHAARVLTGLFDASLFVDLHRLPELFCGFERRPGEGPTLYPVACAPQAWAAAAPFMLLGAVLGLSVQANEERVVFRHPTLPPFLERVSISNLRAGKSSIDLAFHRYPEDVAINVAARRGKLSLVTLK